MLLCQRGGLGCTRSWKGTWLHLSKGLSQTIWHCLTTKLWKDGGGGEGGRGLPLLNDWLGTGEQLHVNHSFCTHYYYYFFLFLPTEVSSPQPMSFTFLSSSLFHPTEVSKWNGLYGAELPARLNHNTRHYLLTRSILHGHTGAACGNDIESCLVQRIFLEQGIYISLNEKQNSFMLSFPLYSWSAE